MRERVRSLGVLAARVLGCFLGASHVVGYSMYASVHSPVEIVPGVVLFVLATLPTQWLSTKRWLLILVIGATSVAYLITGLPFLRESSEIDVRIMFLLEFMLIAAFICGALWHGGERGK
jgi:hypothetical protein